MTPSAPGNAIFEAALDEFAEHGIAGARVDRIATQKRERDARRAAIVEATRRLVDGRY